MNAGTFDFVSVVIPKGIARVINYKDAHREVKAAFKRNKHDDKSYSVASFVVFRRPEDGASPTHVLTTELRSKLKRV